MIIGRRRPVRIGLSARILHPEQGASGIRAKTLQVLEQSIAEWVLARWFGGTAGGSVVSIHHQGIRRYGRDIVVEATAEDEVVEAIRWTGRSFVCGVQWHPEFHQQAGTDLLDCMPLLEAFLSAAKT